MPESHTLSAPSASPSGRTLPTMTAGDVEAYLRRSGLRALLSSAVNTLLPSTPVDAPAALIRLLEDKRGEAGICSLRILITPRAVSKLSICARISSAAHSAEAVVHLPSHVSLDAPSAAAAVTTAVASFGDSIESAVAGMNPIHLSAIDDALMALPDTATPPAFTAPASSSDMPLPGAADAAWHAVLHRVRRAVSCAAAKLGAAHAHLPLPIFLRAVMTGMDATLIAQASVYQSEGKPISVEGPYSDAAMLAQHAPDTAYCMLAGGLLAPDSWFPFQSVSMRALPPVPQGASEGVQERAQQAADAATIVRSGSVLSMHASMVHIFSHLQAAVAACTHASGKVAATTHADTQALVPAAGLTHGRAPVVDDALALLTAAALGLPYPARPDAPSRPVSASSAHTAGTASAAAPYQLIVDVAAHSLRMSAAGVAAFQTEAEEAAAQASAAAAAAAAAASTAKPSAKGGKPSSAKGAPSTAASGKPSAAGSKDKVAGGAGNTVLTPAAPAWCTEPQSLAVDEGMAACTSAAMYDLNVSRSSGRAAAAVAAPNASASTAEPAAAPAKGAGTKASSAAATSALGNDASEDVSATAPQPVHVAQLHAFLRELARSYATLRPQSAAAAAAAGAGADSSPAAYDSLALIDAVADGALQAPGVVLVDPFDVADTGAWDALAAMPRTPGVAGVWIAASQTHFLHAVEAAAHEAHSQPAASTFRHSSVCERLLKELEAVFSSAAADAHVITLDDAPTLSLPLLLARLSSEHGQRVQVRRSVQMGADEVLDAALAVAAKADTLLLPAPYAEESSQAVASLLRLQAAM